MLKRTILICSVLAIAVGVSLVAQQSGNIALWVERDVSIPYDGIMLHGILTLPPTGTNHPAVVLVDGAAGPNGRKGVSSWTFSTHAQRLAIQGFAVLRYDPPGIGQSEGDRGVDTLDARAIETLAVAEALRQQPDINPKHVGLWGASQGGWVIAMVAAQAPESIAFLVMVSGTTVSVAEQQVYGVEMQSMAAGIEGDDLAKAVLVARLLIDWQISNPIFQQLNESDITRLGSGPWSGLADIIYGSAPLSAEDELPRVIELLDIMDAESWSASLYLGSMYIPTLRRIPPSQLAAGLDSMSASLLADPRAYFERVTCPTLALFGEDDLHVPVERSVSLLREYFTACRNEDLTVVVFSDAGHGLNDFMPAYWDALYAWLEALRTSWGTLPRN